MGVALLGELADADFVVPTPLPPDAGEASVDGVVVQRWIHARQPTPISDWKLVAAELRRLHDMFAGHRRRPGCHVATELDHTGPSVDADLSILPGDVADEVLAVFACGRMPTCRSFTATRSVEPADHLRWACGILDWDESRADVVDHDLSNLGVQGLTDKQHVRAPRCRMRGKL